jgi:hypothetical protein
MAISDLLKRRVRARPDEEEEVYSDASVSASKVQSDEEQLDESDSEDASEGSVDENDDEVHFGHRFTSTCRTNHLTFFPVKPFRGRIRIRRRRPRIRR